MAAHGLTENHERGLLASVQYASKLIRDCEEILAASNRPSPLNRYTGGLTPPQRKIVEAYLHRRQQQLLRALDAAGISPPPARISAVHALANAMMLDGAVSEMQAPRTARRAMAARGSTSQHQSRRSAVSVNSGVNHAEHCGHHGRRDP
jgi:hypothetical protein